ncbi:F0F1 ATP synthase subunit delta [Desulfohalovibrio reitneri]|uniref:F0F1 ATP synthase subunit delta n=1 Tax=Desulfohalovibrio reitneri TaxID=1307759 RepID=UPI0004A6D040|nr:F0F1 ATP synthase subunit delta [Desulfohalovibrio reitneri]
MLIDWFTVGAQIVNFLVLMALLKIFLYDRIVRAMDKREERISASLQEADQRTEKADQERERLREERRELEMKREEVLDDARREAEKRREEMLRDAKDEAEALRRRFAEAFEREKRSLASELREGVVREFTDLLRKAMRILAGTDLEDRAAEVFQQRLDDLDETQCGKLAQGAERDGGRLAVTTAFELPGKLKSALTRKIHQRIGEDVECEYATDGEVLLGVELSAGGARVAWSMREYLRRLEESVMEVLESRGYGDEDAPAESGDKPAAGTMKTRPAGGGDD